MREGVLPLNIIISVFYIGVAALAVYVLKKSSKNLKKIPKTKDKAEEGWRETVNFNKIIALSWFKKYTIVGAALHEDKKYLLKEFLFLAAYSVTCLKINRIIIWPVTFSLFLLPIVLVLFDLFLKKIETNDNQEPSKIETPQKNKVNAVKNQGQSQMQIESVNIDAIPAFSAQPLEGKVNQNAKQSKNMNRTYFQVIMNCCLCLSSIMMLFQTIMTLTNSVSNSGQLNITSVLIIFSIDQFGIRPAAGLLMFTIIKIIQKFTQQQILQGIFVSSLCQQELRDIIIEFLEQKRRKQQEMTASPPKKKQQSPSRVPKAPSSAEHPTYLNLINLQPTRRKTQEQQQQDISAGLEQIYLTTLEKQMFGDNESGQYGSATKRRGNKQNKDNSYLSAVQKFTIEQEQDSDQIDGRQDPLKECTLNRIDPFNFDLSPMHYTKRRAVPIRKKHKRVLNLTGSSPYLQYLPDMLKNVQKFKHTPKQTRIL